MKYIAVIFSVLIIFYGVVTSGDAISFYASLAAFYMISLAETIQYYKKEIFLSFIPVVNFIFMIIFVFALTGNVFKVELIEGVRYIGIDPLWGFEPHKMKMTSVLIIMLLITTFLNGIEWVGTIYKFHKAKKCDHCKQPIKPNLLEGGS